MEVQIRVVIVMIDLSSLVRWEVSGVTSSLPVLISCLVSHVLVISVVGLMLSSNHLSSMILVVIWVLVLVVSDWLESMLIIPVIVVVSVSIMIGMMSDWIVGVSMVGDWCIWSISVMAMRWILRVEEVLLILIMSWSLVKFKNKVSISS